MGDNRIWDFLNVPSTPTSPNDFRNVPSTPTLPPETRPASPALPEIEVLEPPLDPGLEPYLCLRCSQIDFKATFAPSNGRCSNGGDLLYEQRKEFDHRCQLCAMVVWVAQISGVSLRKIQRQGLTLSAFESCDRLGVQIDGTNCETSSIVLGIHQKSETHFLSRFLGDQAVTQVMRRAVIAPTIDYAFPPESATPGVEYYALTASAFVDDFASLRCTVLQCLDSHQCEARLRAGGDYQIRVIDCETRRIIPLKEGYRYIALSYVWGAEANRDDRSTVDQITQLESPFVVPSTIEDAITVVRKMKERYLWVDRYCILNDADKHVQIQNMHIIYSRALMTIVDLEGINADSGLCGISRPRRAQFRLQRPTGTLATVPPHLAYHVDKSKWATRGWTYQEAVLSTRCLFFTIDGVYFACRQHIKEECIRSSWPQNAKLAPTEHLSSDMFNVGIYRRHRERNTDFDEHLQAYSVRELSHDADALNAMRGVLLSHHEYSYWGVPLLVDGWPVQQPTVNSSFARGLSWKSLGGERRRVGFPSWSWTSLHGGAMYEALFLDELYVDWRERAACCSIHSKTEGLIPLSGLVEKAKLNKTKVIAEETEQLVLHTHWFDVHFSGDNYQRAIPVQQAVQQMLAANDGRGPIGCFELDITSFQAKGRAYKAVFLYGIERKNLVEASTWMVIEETQSGAQRVGLITHSNLTEGSGAIDLNVMEEKTVILK